jgi:hypothetical protein
MRSDTRRFSFGDEFDAEAARIKLEKAHEALADAKAEAKHAAQGMLEHGRTELEIATRLGVTRRTVRRWVGRSAL